MDSRARSTKTRIETTNWQIDDSAKWIREQDPLKQGLKRHFIDLHDLFVSYSRARSTKTRIETWKTN